MACAYSDYIRRISYHTVVCLDGTAMLPPDADLGQYDTPAFTFSEIAGSCSCICHLPSSIFFFFIFIANYVDRHRHSQMAFISSLPLPLPLPRPRTATTPTTPTTCPRQPHLHPSRPRPHAPHPTPPHASLKTHLTTTLLPHIPTPLLILLFSALPLIELRGSIPLALYLSLPPLSALLISILGNLLPLPIFYLTLHYPPLRRLLSPFLRRAQKKAEPLVNARWRALALALFVAVPLPGTGGWTGVLVAYVMGLSPVETMLSVGAGVVVAGLVVFTACLLGWIGGAIVLVTAAVLVAFGQRLLRRDTTQPRQSD